MAYQQPPHQQRQVVRLPEPSQVGGLVVRGVTQFAKRNKVITGAYLLGWIFLLFVGSGARLTLQQQKDYNRIMNSIDLQAEYDATSDYWRARQLYQSTKGWFWSCDDRCQRNKHRMEEAEMILNDIRKESAARMGDAKRTAGILSEVAVSEVKDSFFQYLYQGKQFAKRQSAWDALFIGIRTMTRGRDESWIEYGLKVLMQVLMNFTMGLIMALLFFWFSLWSIIRSYQTNPIIALLVFLGASAAAFSYVLTYLLAIYGAAGAGVYGFLKVAESSQAARLGNAGRPGRVGYNQQRPHYQ